MSEQLDQQQAAALGAKIEAFAASLSDHERDAFASALWNGDADDETSGFTDLSPMSRTLLQVHFTAGSSKHVFPNVQRSTSNVMGKGPIPS
jgi:hypothetical protein